MRVTLQALAAVLGGTQSLHTNGFDEALGLPTERAAKIALRTQQIIGYESGVVDTVDPLAGSYFVESLTDEVEAGGLGVPREDRRAWAARWRPSRPATMQDEIEQAAYEYTKAIDDGEQVIVGVNRYVDDGDAEPPRSSRSTRSCSASRPSGSGRSAPSGTTPG